MTSACAAALAFGSAALRRSASRACRRLQRIGVGRAGGPANRRSGLRRRRSSRLIGARAASALSCAASCCVSLPTTGVLRPFCQSPIAFTVASDCRLPSIGPLYLSSVRSDSWIFLRSAFGAVEYRRVVGRRSLPGCDRGGRLGGSRRGGPPPPEAQAAGFWKQRSTSPALCRRTDRGRQERESSERCSEARISDAAIGVGRELRRQADHHDHRLAARRSGHGR